MYVKGGFWNCLRFVKTHYYSNKQPIVHGNIDHNILMKKRNRLQSTCIKGDINLDFAPKEPEI